MWREMIENVIAIATSASGVFWAMIAGIVRGLSQLGGHEPEEAHHATVIVPRNHRSGSAAGERSGRDLAIAVMRRDPRGEAVGDDREQEDAAEDARLELGRRRP